MPSAENDAAVKWDARPMFALDADVTVYWPDVRPCYDATPIPPADGFSEHATPEGTAGIREASLSNDGAGE